MKPLYISDDAESQRQHLAVLGQCLGRRGWLPATSGSISVRSGEAVLITAGDLDKSVMTRQDTVMVDPFEGLPLTGEADWPPDETAIHLALYRRLPDCAAVIHAQAPCGTALLPLTGGSGHFGQVVLKEPEMMRGIGSPDACSPALPVVADRVDALRIADHVVAALDAVAADTPPPALFLQYNALVTWGRDIDQARSRLERVVEFSDLPWADMVADEPVAARVNGR